MRFINVTGQNQADLIPNPSPGQAYPLYECNRNADSSEETS